MDVYMLILRLIHILAGVFWAGAMFFTVGLLIPTVAASGPEGGRFMQRLVMQARLPMVMGIAGGLTILSGLAMYERVSGGFQLAWIGTGTGLTLTIGGLAGLLAAVSGGLTGSAGMRLGALMKQIETKGGPPTPDQLAELQGLQKRMRSVSLWTAILLLVAVVAMALARYVRA